MNGSDDRVTIISHFFSKSDQSAEELNQILSASGVLNPVTGLGLASQLVTGPVSRAIAAALDQELGAPIRWAWQTHQALHAAAKVTLSGTGPPEYVSLKTHRISSIHHPQVDVIVDERPRLTITFDLILLFGIEALLLTVQRGHIVGISPAGCHVESTFGAHGMNVTRSRTYALPGLISMQNGIPILPTSAYAAVPQ